MQQSTVAVIGAAGHVGLGLTLTIADAGHFVYGIDVNQSAIDKISSGQVPFVEDGAEAVLRRVLEYSRLSMTADLSVVSRCDVIIIILGTPIDENLNPVVAPLLQLFEQIAVHLCKGQLLILRSTVSPGCTDIIRETLEKSTGMQAGTDFHVVFAPERVVQGRSLIETKTLPQLIGAYDSPSYERAAAFFKTFVTGKCLRLSPVEAELAKLMCNMARYVSFALANEFFLIADEYDANIHNILDAASYEYPRFKVPSPGANVSGPCLFKDGFFLVEHFPFPDLISTSFKINENMPVQILKKIRSCRSIRKVGILGMSFKSGIDDTRYSLSFKLKKLLLANGYEIVCADPHVPRFADFGSAIAGCDCLVLMTPHSEFANLSDLLRQVSNEECLLIDIWGFWPEMRGTSRNGMATAAELMQTSSEPAY